MRFVLFEDGGSRTENYRNPLPYVACWGKDEQVKDEQVTLFSVWDPSSSKCGGGFVLFERLRHCTARGSWRAVGRRFLRAVRVYIYICSVFQRQRRRVCRRKLPPRQPSRKPRSEPPQPQSQPKPTKARRPSGRVNTVGGEN